MAFGEIQILWTGRPCMVDGDKGIFHFWGITAEVIAPSMMVGGHPGGQLAETYGLVEFTDGSVRRVVPTKIRFLDTLAQMQKAFEEESC